MKLSRLVWRSLSFYAATAAVVAVGVAVATGVITGSLLVGDSMTGSLREVALARLGRIDSVVLARNFFRSELSEKIRGDAQLRAGRAASVVVVQGAAINATTNAAVPSVGVIGVDDGFWSFYPDSGRTGSARPLKLLARQVALNESLVRDLGVAQGDAVIVNVGRRGRAPSGTLFEHRSREKVLSSMRCNVAAILPDAGAGSFSLGSDARVPQNVFFAKDWLAGQLGQEGRANAILVESPSEAGELDGALARACDLSDYGLKLVAGDEAVSLQSDNLLLSDALADAAREAAGACGARACAVSVYLATTVRNETNGKTIPYAVLAGVEGAEAWPVETGAADFDDGGMMLNAWAAEDLDARPGDRCTMEYMLPARDGIHVTRSRQFTVRGIVPLSGLAADATLVPDFEGISEADTMHDWKPPFPIELNRITQRDDDYWSLHRATPKAYASLDAVRSIWHSGQDAGTSDWITSVHVIPPRVRDAAFEESFRAALLRRMTPASAGMAFRPVRRIVLESSSGSTDFATLFLSMSMFIVFAAMGLVGVLMRLAAERRAAEAGLLQACGFESRTVRRAIMVEGALLALLGAAAGAPLGVAYSYTIVRALQAAGIGASGFGLRLHVGAGSVAIGSAAGFGAGLLAVWWGTHRLGKVGVLDLLGGWRAVRALHVPSRRRAWLAAASLAGGALALLAAVGETWSFFAGGFLLLAAALCACRAMLAGAAGKARAGVSMLRLVLRNAAANRSRSMLAIGLFASAAFVVVAAAANRQSFSAADAGAMESGTGGFSLRAVSSIPIPYDFGTPSGRAKLGFPSADEQIFEGVAVYSFTMTSGDDISCLNLAKASSPRVLGVSRSMIARGGFGNNNWAALERGDDDGVPVFGDAASVQWTLHSALGETICVPAASGPVRLKVAGLLSQSIFAGELLMSEQNFRKAFRDDSAPRYFLIETPAGSEERVADCLRRTLGEVGLEVHATRRIIDSVLGVRNMYVSTFVALGGLGVVLGTFGLVAVMLRNALERRGEFALMLATGFRRRHVAGLLVAENAGLLLAGLVCGALPALVAVMPQLRSSDSHVNWAALAAVLGAALAVGAAACAVAACATVRGNLLEALREE